MEVYGSIWCIGTHEGLGYWKQIQLVLIEAVFHIMVSQQS